MCILKCVLCQTYNSANVVMRGSATGKIELFIDGVYVNSTTLPYTPVVTSIASGFVGFISDVQIYTLPLQPCTVRRHVPSSAASRVDAGPLAVLDAPSPRKGADYPHILFAAASAPRLDARPRLAHHHAERVAVSPHAGRGDPLLRRPRIPGSPALAVRRPRGMDVQGSRSGADWREMVSGL